MPLSVLGRELAKPSHHLIFTSFVAEHIAKRLMLGPWWQLLLMYME